MNFKKIENIMDFRRWSIISQSLENSHWKREEDCAMNAFIWPILTLWCRVLLEKLTGLQLVKKFPVFYGTRRFITALTSARLHMTHTCRNPTSLLRHHTLFPVPQCHRPYPKLTLQKIHFLVCKTAHRKGQHRQFVSLSRVFSDLPTLL